MAAVLHRTLAPVGTTGTGTFPLGGLDGAKSICLEFKIEAVGATPTVTYELDGSTNSDGSASNPAADVWEQLSLRFTNPATAAKLTDTQTGTGTFIYWVEGLDIRSFAKVRLNVTANTNVTFSARLHVREV